MDRQRFLTCPPDKSPCDKVNPFQEIPKYTYSQCTFKDFTEDEIRSQAGKDVLPKDAVSQEPVNEEALKLLHNSPMHAGKLLQPELNPKVSPKSMEHYSDWSNGQKQHQRTHPHHRPRLHDTDEDRSQSVLPIPSDQAPRGPGPMTRSQDPLEETDAKPSDTDIPRRCQIPLTDLLAGASISAQSKNKKTLMGAITRSLPTKVIKGSGERQTQTPSQRLHHQGESGESQGQGLISYPGSGSHHQPIDPGSSSNGRSRDQHSAGNTCVPSVAVTRIHTGKQRLYDQLGTPYPLGPPPPAQPRRQSTSPSITTDNRSSGDEAGIKSDSQSADEGMAGEEGNPGLSDDAMIVDSEPSRVPEEQYGKPAYVKDLTLGRLNSAN